MEITDEELRRLESSKNDEEWNSICDDIKASRLGNYPSDWWVKVMVSGLANRVAANWGRPNAMTISIRP